MSERDRPGRSAESVPQPRDTPSNILYQTRQQEIPMKDIQRETAKAAKEGVGNEQMQGAEASSLPLRGGASDIQKRREKSIKKQEQAKKPNIDDEAPYMKSPDRV